MPLGLAGDDLIPQWNDATHIANECNADGCWEKHWGTNNLAEVSGTSACALTAAEMRLQYPAWYADC